MPLAAEIHAVLQSFFGLLTRPFEQSPAQSVRGAVTAIVLSLALVIIWTLISAIAAGGARRQLEVTRNISVTSSWIAATSALVLVAEQVHPASLDRSPREEFVRLGLLLLLRFGAALGMTLALWVSTALLTRALVN